MLSQKLPRGRSVRTTLPAPRRPPSAASSLRTSLLGYHNAFIWEDVLLVTTCDSIDMTVAFERARGRVGRGCCAQCQRQGICVECQDDCDCGVDQFCGIDFEAPRVLPSFSLNEDCRTVYPFLSAHVNKIFSGVAIKSRCLDYNVEEGKRCKRSDDGTPRIMHASSLDYDRAQGNVYSSFKVVDYQRYPRKRMPMASSERSIRGHPAVASM